MLCLRMFENKSYANRKMKKWDHFSKSCGHEDFRRFFPGVLVDLNTLVSVSDPSRSVRTCLGSSVCRFISGEGLRSRPGRNDVSWADGVPKSLNLKRPSVEKTSFFTDETSWFIRNGAVPFVPAQVLYFSDLFVLLERLRLLNVLVVQTPPPKPKPPPLALNEFHRE